MCAAWGVGRQAASSTAAIRGARIGLACRIVALLLCAVFLRSVARFYHPGFGFTALIGFPEGESESSPLHGIPHYLYPPFASYDGQFYAQRALDPLARDPALDRTMDLAPYRARRILFSWTAYVAGFGRPVWILEAYALQNVVCWLIIAVLLTRWCDLRTSRGLVVWTAIMFSRGLLWSVRFALLDGPSLLLLTLAVLAVEKGRPLLSAAIGGIAALGRETNVLAIVAQPIPRTRREWLRAVAAAVLVVVPVLVWMDYLWSIYRSTLLLGTDQLLFPGTAFRYQFVRTMRAVAQNGLLTGAGLDLCVIVSVAAQAAGIAASREWRRPWWRVAAAYALLALLMDRVLWDPHTGAIMRVLLPLTVGFNLQLTRIGGARRFWPWFIVGNLHLVTVFRVMPLV
jgi:hypothetical protein